MTRKNLPAVFLALSAALLLAIVLIGCAGTSYEGMEAPAPTAARAAARVDSPVNQALTADGVRVQLEEQEIRTKLADGMVLLRQRDLKRAEQKFLAAQLQVKYGEFSPAFKRQWLTEIQTYLDRAATAQDMRGPAREDTSTGLEGHTTETKTTAVRLKARLAEQFDTFYQQGQYDDALVVLERMRALDPEDASIPEKIRQTTQKKLQMWRYNAKITQHEEEKQFAGKTEEITPWYPITKYPDNWEALRARRLQEIPPWFFAGPNVEVWVIEAPAEARPAPPDDSPRSGALMATLPSDSREVPLPLKHTDVKAAISGYIATVDVTQQFLNPYNEKIEAVYLFPLPQDAAVTDFIMVIGTRKIRGIIREREEAKRVYAEAKRQGYVASLLTQERANVFTQRVANIEPGRQIDVNIRYFQTLSFADGWLEFDFPMVVGPRFNPPGETHGVGAAGRGSAGVTGQTTEVQYLRPGERSGHDVSLSVRVDAGLAIEEMSCPTHAVATKQESPSVATVALSALDAIPNKDFVLRYRLAGNSVKSTLLAHRDKRGGFFTLMLVPPADLASLERRPVEMVFVVDRSGSTEGWPISIEKKAAERALRKLGPDDTFQVISFANDTTKFAESPVPATPENIRRGAEHIQAIQSGGGTMMLDAVKAALHRPGDPRRRRIVAFMTDGFVGNEDDMLAEVHQCLGDARIFSFGIGSSPNRYLIERMAQMGGGAVAYVGSNGTWDSAVEQFYTRISHPALTDITIDWGGMKVTDVYPKQIPDLFVGRPVIVTGRFEGAGTGAVRVNGWAGIQARQIALRMNAGSPSADHPGIAAVWARKKIAELANMETYSTDPDVSRHIKDVALDFGLMSSYTAFVAVDSLTRTSGDHGVTVVQPVPVPDGTRYETTVEE